MSDDTPYCPILTGRVWAFGLEVPADCIAPPKAATAAEPGALLMTPIDPDFPTRVQVGDMLVAGSFGSDTVDEGPIRAIRAAGISAVLATTLDPSFARLALAAGLPVIEIYEAMGIHTGETLRVDLEGARVVNMSSGNRYPIRNLDDDILQTYRRELV
ncbi:MAG: hypothetical protein P8R42_04180 [Candidatus Binatia bacterium]|nr:hypothetical protein [Candidatus Binatia bacterium]